jgi:Na+/H+-dicarboxylate symporter
VFFIVTLFAAAAYAALLAPPLINRIPLDPAAIASMKASASSAGTTAAQNATNIPTFSRWLVDLVPANPVKAAADGALLPLIIFTLMFGLALLTLPAERKVPVIAFFQGLGDAALTVVRWVLQLAPLGVFALALPLATRMGASAAGALAAFVVTVIGITVSFAVVVLYPLAAVVGRVPLGEFARAIFAAQAVAFSSRSSLAALPAMIESARSRLGLPPEISGFFLPLAASTYRVAGALAQPTAVLFIARLYGVELTATQLMTVVLTVVPTTFSVPGIPAGSIIVMVPILIGAGLPAEGIGVLLGIDAITDMFRTATNVTGDMVGAVVLGRRDRVAAPMRAVSEATP